MRKLFLLFAISFVFFFPYFLRQFLVEPDSYYFLQPNQLQNEATGAIFVSFLINGNIFYAKTLLFCCLFASVAIIAFLGSQFNEKNGWKAGLFVFLSPIFLLEFLKFESEAIAYPLLFLSLLFFFKEGKKNKFFSLFLVFFAFFFWKGALIYFIPMIFSFFFAVLPLFFALFLEKFDALKHLGNFLPNPAVQESAFLGSGVTFHWALLLGGLGYFDKKMLKTAPFLLFFGAIAFLNAKFAIHLAPLLAIALPNALKAKRIEPFLYGLLFAIILLTPFAILTIYEPTQTQIEQVQLAVKEAKGEMIYNSWTYGHLIEYFGGKALAKAGGLQPDLNCSNCIVLSNEEMPCNKINEIKPFVYHC